MRFPNATLLLFLLFTSNLFAQCTGTYQEPNNGATWIFQGSAGLRTDNACWVTDGFSGNGFLTCNNGFNQPVTLSTTNCITITSSFPWFNLALAKSQGQIDKWNNAAAQARALVDRLNKEKDIVCGAIALFNAPAAALCLSTYYGFMADAQALANAYAQAAVDPPDPNFTVIPTPVFPNLSVPVPSGANAATIALTNASNALLANMSRQLGYANAGITAFNRASGAINAGSVTWWKQQTDASYGFLSQVGGAAAVEPMLLSDYQNALWNVTSHTSYTISQSDFAAFVANVNANGVDPNLTAAFAQVGDPAILSADYVANLNDPAAINNFPTNFPEFMTDSNLIASLTQLASVLNMPFAAFSASVESSKAKPSFELRAKFTLGPAASINVLAEPVSLQIGNLSELIPAGSFKKNKSGHFTFSGTINGVKQEAVITPGTANSYTLSLEGTGALQNLASPATVSLLIGNDFGSASVKVSH